MMIKRQFLVLTVLCVALIFISYFFVDQRLTIYIHQYIDHGIVHQIARVVTTFGLGVIYLVALPILFLIARFYLHKHELSMKIVYLFAVVVVSGIVCDILKMIFGRARPSLWFNHHIFGFTFFKHHSNYYSFPSGHVTTAASFGVAMFLLFPKLRAYCVLFITAVAASRVILEWHYLSDVVGGFYLGAVTALVLYRIFNKHVVLLK